MIYSEKWKGPLYCNDKTDKNGKALALFKDKVEKPKKSGLKSYFFGTPKWADGDEFLWKIKLKGEYVKIINKKYKGPLYVADNKYGDAFSVKVSVKPVHYVNKGKELWKISLN